MTALARTLAAWRAEKAAYAAKAGDDRPLEGYAGAMGVFSVLTAAVAALHASRRADHPIGPLDLLLVGVASHKLARIISKDAVTSPFRAPFTTYVEPGGPGEVMEEVRGEGARHAVGELLTCPFCLSPWVAAALVGGHAVAPGLTRTLTGVFSAVTVADMLQFAYARLEREAD